MDYTDYVGRVYSPGFPNAYTSELDCTYSLKASGNNFLTISYHTLDLNMNSHSRDIVEVGISIINAFKKIFVPYL